MNHLDFKLLKVISLLMDYPSDELFADDTLNECKDIVATSTLISPNVRHEINAFIDELSNKGAIESQWACLNAGVRCLFGCLNTYMVRAETVGKRWLI